MKVAQVMSEAVTVRPDTPVGELARLMVDRGLDGLPVLEGDGSLAGLVTERDMVAKHARVHLPTYLGILGTSVQFGKHHADEDVRHVLATTAGELMTRDPFVVAPDTDVDDAASTMVEEDVDMLPVLADGRLVGTISRHNILGLLLAEERTTDDAEP